MQPVDYPPGLNMATILVIDPSRSMRSTLKERLEHEGYGVEVAEDTISGMTVYASRHFDLLLCGQPDSPIRTATPWIRLSHDNTPESAMLAMRQGASDFISKPINMNRLLAAIRKSLTDPPRYAAVDTPPLAEEPDEPCRRARTRTTRPEPIIGESAPARHLKYLIDKVAPTDARVLIMGDNGTGKELVARWLHEESRRKTGPFVEVNCAAIPSELIESELFGHEKGAFTSAVKMRRGKFEQAQGGTLFLDEIGDMSLAAQAKVLRVLQERKISRVGSDRDIDVDVRVVAATNKNLPAEIARGTFREDLYHRLSVIVVRVPPLAERLDDIPLLVNHFLTTLCAEYHVPVKRIEPDAVALLQTMPWSGNIRELHNVVERLVILGEDPLTVSDVECYARGLQ